MRILLVFITTEQVKAKIIKECQYHFLDCVITCVYHQYQSCGCISSSASCTGSSLK